MILNQKRVGRDRFLWRNISTSCAVVVFVAVAQGCDLVVLNV